ncbi:signal transduction histidine kinase [Kitasatospora gansuensis]|uniref:histidine kinase n=1 Tax=Kitasatospora gansuensis TaxID=258050 RepID=A0A7W7WG83_9ACTN|nr:ATP-binding protein [Kitasatospora gansuensis]MBB4946542.1 signal transduction histidine kinase [Kitasatospora gansuensis]
MRARTRPDRGASVRRSNGSTAWWAAVGLLVGAGGGAAAVALAPAAHQSAVAGTVGGALLLWCGLLALACRQLGRAHRSTEELDATRAELTVTTGHAATLHAELSAAHYAAAELRAALAATRAEADAAHADLRSAEAGLAAARAEAEELRESVERDRRERAALDRLSAEVLPEVVGRLRSGSSVETVLAPHRALPHAALLRTVATEIGRGERQRAAALAVCATAAGRVQALATSMHAELREMQHRHGEEVLGDLLTLDHATAQAGRMADSIAVLTGARSGRRWTRPIGVESILRGALGRIGAYQRVRLHSASTAAVAGYAAEGVMHALAELLDNAANFSAPPAEVHVYVEEAHSGLVITVEDGGLGLGESWLKRAEAAVSAEPLDLTALSAGTRLGLAVVGVLARKHGLQISFRPSARGGTGVVVLIPEQLITHPAPVRAEPQEPAPVHERPAPQPVSQPAVEITESTENGLPQRRRGQTLSTALSTAPEATPAAQPVRTDAAVAAARFGAFRRALQAGPGATPDDASQKDDSR